MPLYCMKKTMTSWVMPLQQKCLQLQSIVLILSTGSIKCSISNIPIKASMHSPAQQSPSLALTAKTRKYSPASETSSTADMSDATNFSIMLEHLEYIEDDLHTMLEYSEQRLKLLEKKVARRGQRCEEHKAALNAAKLIHDDLNDALNEVCNEEVNVDDERFGVARLALQIHGAHYGLEVLIRSPSDIVPVAQWEDIVDEFFGDVEWEAPSRMPPLESIDPLATG